MMTVHNLVVRYPETTRTAHAAVDGMTFHIAHGEVVGLLGESGSGKSTLGMAVCGTLPPRARVVEGAVRWQEDTAWRGGARAVLIPQTPSLTFSPFLRCGGQVEDVLRARGLTRQDAREQAHALLRETGLEARQAWAAYPHELSGGELQRVAIARALAMEPQLLVADEACSALDLLHGIRLRKMLQSLQRARGLSILWITHHPRELLGFASRMLVLERGRMVDQRSTDAQALGLAPPCTRRLLDAMPSRWMPPEAEGRHQSHPSPDDLAQESSGT